MTPTPQPKDPVDERLARIAADDEAERVERYTSPIVGSVHPDAQHLADEFAKMTLEEKLAYIHEHGHKPPGHGAPIGK